MRALREGMDLEPARPGRAQRRQRADAQPGRARRDEPDAGHVAGRIAAGLELTLSQLLRLDEGGSVSIVRAGEVRSGGGRRGHTFEVLTPPLPGLRAELSRHVLDARRRHRRRRRPADARARQPRDRPRRRPAPSSLVIDGERHELAAGDTVTFDADLSHHFENPGPDEATFLAVVSAGLRRS